MRKLAGKALRTVIGDSLYIRLRIGSLREHSYLRDVRGIIHVGANTGQERDLYAAFGLHVAWIEPIPEVFEALQSNIAGFPRQRAYNYLVTDRDDEEYTLNIADNDGASSSIFDFSKHKEMWPQISYKRAIKMKGTRLESIVTKEQIDLRQFGALLLDTQGSELKVLMGAEALLSNFAYIKTEVADFELYKGCCEMADVSQFMLAKGFRERSRLPFMDMPGVGTCFDIIYERANFRRSSTAWPTWGRRNHGGDPVSR